MTALSHVSAHHVQELFAKRANDLHEKVNATRDAYFGFIFPISRNDFREVSDIFGLKHDVAQTLYREGGLFSTFRLNDNRGHITNHIMGASILALRGKSLDNGLASVNDGNLGELIKRNEQVVMEIAEARASWFGKIYFPSAAFSNAISVFGGKVTAEGIYKSAQSYGFAASAGDRKTTRGDFGIGVWLMLLGFAP